MQDETLSEPLPLPRPRRTLTTVLVALLAFALGGMVVGWLVNSGNLPYALPSGATKPAGLRSTDAAAPSSAKPAPPASAAAAVTDPASLGSVETRLALLEDRLTRIDGEASAASGNAARAEGLLIAFATRRKIAKGEPLDYLADQLKLRFGGAQPQAVQTIIAFSRSPVTLDDLVGQLEAAAPALAGTVRDESTWTRIRRELASLFVVRRAPVAAATPAMHIARAHLMLVRGQIEDAIAEVQRLPGADGAQAWIDDARRYEATQHALDVIETAAMLEPRALRDGAGKAVTQPSPIAPPADAAATASGAY
ncbi:MAG: hypothetical protein JF595_11120 [Sphingomonadales bacterium]|nr:hypothetical protein [Sphingomonadales bacterium]